MTSKKPVKPKIRFPGDEGAHPNFLVEWWYGHFSLSDAEGREYGAMVAYFNFGLRIISISNFGTGKFHHFVSGSPLHYVEKRLDLRWGRDHWFRSDSDSFVYSLESYGPGLGFNLGLKSLKPPLLLPGGSGGVSKWTGGDSYYYSLTRLKAKGQIELSGDKLKVEGTGWMDHQWMQSLGEGGWDWFAVQLDNNTEVVFWHIVNPNESIKSCDLTVMLPDNSIYHTKDFVLERLGTWVSPQSGREYGTIWRVQGKAYDLDLQIKARHVQQEIRIFESLSTPNFHFWEGVMSVSGRLDGKSVSGISYTELVRLSSSGIESIK
jgi:predicted secreted hydrolase